MLLEAVDLTFGYGRGRVTGPRPGIQNVALSFGRGALVGILGPNGSGKTTLLRLLAGTLKPQSGRVVLDGDDIAEMSRAVLARRFAVVPQETHLAFDYTVIEIALMGRYPHLGAFEIEGPDDLASAVAALEATGTRDLADRPFRTLSGGEKQRAIIASALAQLDDRTKGPRSSPARVLFLDEPTASLDLRYQIELAELIQDLHDREDVTIILSTHDVHFARTVCEELILLKAGRVLSRGPTAEVLTSARLADLYDVAAASPLMDALT